MNLPQEVKEKIDSLIVGHDLANLKRTRELLTDRYKTQTGNSVSKIKDSNDSLVYAISRMSATYVVIKTLLENLKAQGFFGDNQVIFDIGSGTGAGYLAISESFKDAQIELFERDDNMRAMAKQLINKEANNLDIAKQQPSGVSDLTICSYVLSEMQETDRIKAVSNMLETSNMLLLIDTGTPETYKEFMEIKNYAIENGYQVLAPCMTKNCTLADDYCQFYARVERTGIQRNLKNAELSYEDEKYFYLLIAKKEVCKTIQDKSRVIRRPVYEQNRVKLVVCDKDGSHLKIVAKNEKEKYKMSRKIKINELL